jgi:hypothetical protein
MVEDLIYSGSPRFFVITSFVNSSYPNTLEFGARVKMPSANRVSALDAPTATTADLTRGSAG